MIHDGADPVRKQERAIEAMPETEHTSHAHKILPPTPNAIHSRINVLQK
jgi:hypothetical protein